MRPFLYTRNESRNHREWRGSCCNIIMLTSGAPLYTAELTTVIAAGCCRQASCILVPHFCRWAARCVEELSLSASMRAAKARLNQTPELTAAESAERRYEQVLRQHRDLRRKCGRKVCFADPTAFARLRDSYAVSATRSCSLFFRVEYVGRYLAYSCL